MNDVVRIEEAIAMIASGIDGVKSDTSFIIWHSSNHQPTHKIDGVTYHEFELVDAQKTARAFYQRMLDSSFVGKTVYHIDGKYQHDMPKGNQLAVAYALIEKDKALLLKGSKRLSEKAITEMRQLLTTLNKATFN